MYARRPDEPPLLLRSSGEIPFSKLKVSLDNQVGGWSDPALHSITYALSVAQGFTLPPLRKGSGHHESPAHAYRAPPREVPTSAYPGRLGGQEPGRHNSAVRDGRANAAPHS